MKKLISTLATLSLTISCVGNAPATPAEPATPDAAGPQIDVRATVASGVAVPDGLEARVMWMAPSEDAKDGEIEGGGSSLRALISNAQTAVPALPATVSLAAALPAEDVLTTRDGTSWALAVVMVGATATLDALEAGQAIPADAALGVSQSVVAHFAGVSAAYLEQGLVNGLQLMALNPDTTILACHQANDDAFEAALAVCDSCAAEHPDATDEEYEEFCGTCQEHETTACAGPKIVYMPLSEQIDISLSTAWDVVDNQLAESTLLEVIRVN
jgi:hypothetical protein